MKIVIAGAGGIGFHLAKLLSSAQHDIVIIDHNAEVLEYAQTHLDVQTVYGDACSIEVLERSNVSKASIFLASTTFENDNIVSCILAKKMGALQTVARINKISNLGKAYKSVFAELGVDKIISPSLLAAQEIIRLIELSQVTDSFDFDNGKVSLLGITLEETSPYLGLSIGEIKALGQSTTIPIAILRGNQTILPRDNTVIRRKDHVYFISEKKNIQKILDNLGKAQRKVKSIMFVGGNVISSVAAKALSEEYKVTIVEQDERICKQLVSELDNVLVIKGDPSNFELLKEEGLSEMDAFIAVTPNSETNIITSLMAETLGVYKTIALVENLDYTHISQNIGVNTIINKKIIAANNIFRYVRKGKVEDIASLHGVDGEVIEYLVTKENKLTSKPLRRIKFPENAIIGAVVRQDEVIIPDGDFIFELHDRVIILALSSAIGKIEDLFR